MSSFLSVTVVLQNGAVISITIIFCVHYSYEIDLYGRYVDFIIARLLTQSLAIFFIRCAYISQENLFNNFYIFPCGFINFPWNWCNVGIPAYIEYFYLHRIMLVFLMTLLAMYKVFLAYPFFFLVISPGLLQRRQMLAWQTDTWHGGKEYS